MKAIPKRMSSNGVKAIYLNCTPNEADYLQILLPGLTTEDPPVSALIPIVTNDEDMRNSHRLPVWQWDMDQHLPSLFGPCEIPIVLRLPFVHGALTSNCVFVQIDDGLIYYGKQSCHPFAGHVFPLLDIPDEGVEQKTQKRYLSPVEYMKAQSKFLATAISSHCIVNVWQGLLYRGATVNELSAFILSKQEEFWTLQNDLGKDAEEKGA